MSKRKQGTKINLRLLRFFFIYLRDFILISLIFNIHMFRLFSENSDIDVRNYADDKPPVCLFRRP